MFPPAPHLRSLLRAALRLPSLLLLALALGGCAHHEPQHSATAEQPPSGTTQDGTDINRAGNPQAVTTSPVTASQSAATQDITTQATATRSTIASVATRQTSATQTTATLANDSPPGDIPSAAQNATAAERSSGWSSLFSRYKPRPRATQTTEPQEQWETDARAAIPGTRQSFAQPRPTQPATQATPETELKFGVNAFTTLQYEAADIYYHSPPAFPPSYQERQSVFAGQSLLLVITAKNFAISEDGAADISYRIGLTGPGGTVLQSLQDATDTPLYQGRVTSPAVTLFPHNTPLVHFGEDQPTGLYTIQLRVRDNTSGKQQELERRVRVRSYRPPALPEGFDPIEWMETYYLHPSPELALPALYLLGSLSPRTWPPHLQNDYTNARSRMLGFYDRLLTDNPWLLPHFAEAHTRALYLPDDHPRNLRTQIEQVLRIHLRRYSQRPQGVPQRLWSQSRSPLFIPSADGSPDVLTADGRERLWGEFFASGSFRPIYQLAATSALYPALDANSRRIQATLLRLERSGLPAMLSPGALHSLDRDSQALIYTLWSLHEQAQKHPQVRAYLQNIGELARHHDPASIASLYDKSGSGRALDKRALELLASVADAGQLQAAGVPPINTTADLSYRMLQDNHDLLRESYDHYEDLRSEDPDLRTQQLIRLDELADASAATLLRWQSQMLRPHRIATEEDAEPGFPALFNLP